MTPLELGIGYLKTAQNKLKYLSINKEEYEN